MAKFPKVPAFVIAALACSTLYGGGVEFHSRPLLAGKASLENGGFVVSRTLGVAAFAPELRFPVEIAYNSASVESGIFGHGWHSPQLESSLKWDADGLVWVSPWGETMKFFPKKLPKGAEKGMIKIPHIEEARKGRGLFLPYGDWEADSPSADYAKAREFSITGRNSLKGWKFSYSDGRLESIETPYGAVAEIEYDAGRRPTAIVSGAVRFVEIAYREGLAVSITVNGVETAIGYRDGKVVTLPNTVDGRAKTKTVKFLSSMRKADLEPEKFAYKDGYLASTERGNAKEEFSVDVETAADRKRNLESAEPGSGVAHSGKISGRLLKDGDFEYSYDGGIRLTDKTGANAHFSLDRKLGILSTTGFDGRSRTVYYFMRTGTAYFGKVRKVVDGRGRTLAGYRYDELTGKLKRTTDRLGNHLFFEYDGAGNCTKIFRKAGLFKEPVREIVCNSKNRPVKVRELDAKGECVLERVLSYGPGGRLSGVSDGCGNVKIECNRSGFPARIKDDFASVSFAYDKYNRPVSSTDADGISTVREYAAHGGIAKLARKYGQDTLSSLAVGYDGNGLPVSVTDQDGLATACDRDALGRIVKEKYANDTETAYAYDDIGRLTSVLDENGNEIKFAWDRFGISSRLTAADQLTGVERDADGLVRSVSASKDGHTAREIRREYDNFDRVTKVDYGDGEIETFAYDNWGRLSAHTRGKLKETYAYDHFGRLVEKNENGIVYTYSYDKYGRRVSRTIKTRHGETTEEKRSYDRYGRLTEIKAFEKSVKYAYDLKGRITRQTVDGTPIDYTYTKYGQLAGKYLGGKLDPEASVEYEYSKSGKIIARTANGIRHTYEYDGRGQLLAVVDADGNDVERYVYDKAGNMVRKTVNGKTTTFTFDGANQLVSSTTDGVTTTYEYDAAGRLVREGNRQYKYGYLDKVLSVTEGEKVYTYDYHVDGQIANANYGETSESFLWDGLALVKRGEASFINEPHIGGGNPVVSSTGTSYFNDMLGTTVGTKSGRKYSAAALTAFGERLDNVDSTSPAIRSLGEGWFTGKPQVEGLGHTFLFRNYRASIAKWQTADPMGYPDGWNALAYCNNGVTSAVDLWGCAWVLVDSWNTDLSNPEWTQVSRTAPTSDDLWNLLTRYGMSAWLRPYQHKKSEDISDPALSYCENLTDNWWYKNTTVTYTYTRVDTLGTYVTTKELKDNPSLMNAVADLVFIFGSKIRGPDGQLIGLISNMQSVADALAEIRDCINQYGQDTMWDVEFGTVTFVKERQKSWGFLYVAE